jgi:hypothetical protein
MRWYQPIIDERPKVFKKCVTGSLPFDNTLLVSLYSLLVPNYSLIHLFIATENFNSLMNGHSQHRILPTHILSESPRKSNNRKKDHIQTRDEYRRGNAPSANKHGQRGARERYFALESPLSIAIRVLAA